MQKLIQSSMVGGSTFKHFLITDSQKFVFAF